MAKLTFTCSKLTIETLEKGVKYIQSSSFFLFFVFFGLTLNILHTFFERSIVEFEQVNVSWGAGVLLQYDLKYKLAHVKQNVRD